MTRTRRVVCALAALSLGASVLRAQERGVTLGLSVVGGGRSTLIVLPVAGAAGDSIATIVSRDLRFSDRFGVVETSAAPPVNGPPNYPLFARLSVDGIVQITLLPSGWARVSLHDVGTKAIKTTKDFPLPTPALTPAWRLALHGVSDGVSEWITGDRGIAQTRVAFTRGGRVWLVDFDGANPTPVTPSGMSPQWVPSGRGIVYNVLDGEKNPILYTDLVTGARRTLVAESGVENISPVVSPDGRTLVYARGRDVGMDLYAQPIDGGTPRRITIGNGRASTQPSFSPDGQRVVFNSDRSGHPEVYISSLDGTDVELLTDGVFGDNDYRAGPDWSPDGRAVAFSSRNSRVHQIMVINLRDRSMRQITNDGRNEDPSWAPDARHLVFTSTKTGVRQLWIVDTESGTTRQLTFGQEARLAAWSPRLTTP